MRIFGIIDNLSGLDLLDFLLLKVRIDGIIFFKDNNNSDFVDSNIIRSHLVGMDRVVILETLSRSFENDNDYQKIAECNIDVLIVLGWRRLIPRRILNLLSIGCIGNHGSSEGIRLGRGRSPQNWALIFNKEQFQISIFWVSDGIDDGIEICSKIFRLENTDTIRTSYLKSSMIVSEMISSVLNNEKQLIESARSIQDERHLVNPRYLPKRTPEDGYIDWRKSAQEIYNFIRALTRPFPGARTTDSLGQILIIYSAKIVENRLTISRPPGFVLQVLYDGAALVSTKDGFILITDYLYLEESRTLKTHEVLQSVSFEESMEKLVARHYLRYPELELNKDFDPFKDRR